MSARLERILEHLDSRGAASYQDMAALCGVSTMTIRRDIDKLADIGKAIRTPGGAQRSSAPHDFYETVLANRLHEAVAEKRAIARSAAMSLEAGDTIYVDGGSTCIEFARQAAALRSPLTVVTNSFLVCQELKNHNHHTTICIGGLYDAETFSTYGDLSETSIKGLHFNRAFFSTRGFIPAEGTFESTMGLLRLKQLVAEQSGEVWLLVDHRKFGRRSLCRVLDARRIDTVVTDSLTEPAYLDTLKESGIRFEVASIPDSREGVSDAT